MMGDPNMYAYGDHYPDDSDQPLPLPPEGHPLRKLGQRLTELLDEDHWAECERLLLEGWEHDRIDRKTGADWRGLPRFSRNDADGVLPEAAQRLHPH
ncbi:MAG: hypothetical protein ACYCW7_00465 [Pseudomonadaceae bacterium]